MTSEIEIRPEIADDAAGVRAVQVEAFREHPYSHQTEHRIVDALRAAGALEISLVAENTGLVVGHIAFSRCTVGDLGDGWYLLGPLAVLPGRQGAGIGSALVSAGLDALRARDAAGCVLVGDPGFYGRFGFSSFAGLTHEGVPDEFVLGLPLGERAPVGTIRAHPAFDIEVEAIAADGS